MLMPYLLYLFYHRLNNDYVMVVRMTDDVDGGGGTYKTLALPVTAQQIK
jgi:hypothetical protein